MNLLLVHIHPRPSAALPYEPNVQNYLKLASKWLATQSRGFLSTEALETYLAGIRQRHALVLCDQRGKSLPTEEFAKWVSQHRDSGTGTLVLAIGPADGWPETMRRRADLSISFGAMTMPHALARLVLAEQIYRAATILARHPYHLGH